MNVSRGEKILLVDGTGSESEQLAQLLGEDGTLVTVCAAEDVPLSVSELCEYGLIVLMNVHANDLPEGWDQTLEETDGIWTQRADDGRREHIHLRRHEGHAV
jgi:hypothetical protein